MNVTKYKISGWESGRDRKEPKMAKENNQAQNTELKATLDKSISPVAFNTLGLVPTAAEFTLQLADLQKLIKTEAERYLKDVYKVTFDPNPKNGRVDTYVWIPSKSADLVDKTANENSVISGPIQKYSDQLKTFIERYCDKADKRIYDADGQPYKGIRVSLIKLVEIFFDISGREYKKLYGKDSRCYTQITPVYHKPDKNGYSRLLCFEIKKSERFNFGKGDLRPRKMGKF